ncbi:hypothetical protein Drorol1_Dr00028266 [Drosera rotundifolia]
MWLRILLRNFGNFDGFGGRGSKVSKLRDGFGVWLGFGSSLSSGYEERKLSQTPFHVAAGNNGVEIVQLLLDWIGTGELELVAKNVVRTGSCD